MFLEIWNILFLLAPRLGLKLEPWTWTSIRFLTIGPRQLATPDNSLSKHISRQLVP